MTGADNNVNGVVVGIVSSCRTSHETGSVEVGNWLKVVLGFFLLFRASDLVWVR